LAKLWCGALMLINCYTYRPALAVAVTLARDHVVSRDSVKSFTCRVVTECYYNDVLLGDRQRAARINMWTTMMLDFEGANAVLFCRAEGNPRPTVTWIDPEDRRISSSSSSHGQYLVRAINEPLLSLVYCWSTAQWQT